MQHTILKIVVALSVLFLLPTWSLALDGNKILAQVDKNMQPASYEMYRKLINVEPDGRKKEFVLYSLKKGPGTAVALFLQPASEKGRTTLRQDDNMWLYIPNVGKPIRITSLQSVVGGVFNNSDILRLDYGVEYTVEGVEDKGDNYVLDLKANSSSVAYDRLKMIVDKKMLLPTRIECYAISGMLIKNLQYSKVKDFGDGLVRPSMLETNSPLYKGYKSVMLFARIKKREVPDEVFTLNFLPRIDELR
jgi:outer membrane lipoprotein-sorting protein